VHPGRLKIAIAVTLTVSALLVGGCSRHRPRAVAEAAPIGSAAPLPTASPSESVPPAVPPSGALPVIDYYTAPTGFPADPAPDAAEPLTLGAKPTGKVALYDAPGGVPRAYLTPVMNGVPVTVPIVAQRAGWAAVLLPTANRTIGWLPPDGWTTTPLEDQLVLRRGAHQFSWYHGGVLQQTWTVTVGAPATQTPLGRTFVLGRSKLNGSVYAGLDVLALGALPDNPNAVATGLRGAHIGIHSWYRNEFGFNISNGCIRVPKDGQQLLLTQIEPGTEVLVYA
jgi:hypothetical protein